MAKSANFQTKQNTRVWILDEATMGTTSVAEEYIEMPVTDFSFDEINKHSLSVAPPRTGAGAFTQSDDMVKWQKHDRMFDISISFHGTAQAINRICKALYGDGDGTNTLTGEMPSVVDFRHNVANAIPVSIIFENAYHTGATNDSVFTSCICTGLTLSGDIGSNGGVVMGTATFQTGYNMTTQTSAISGTETTLSSQTTMFNVHDLQTTTLAGEDLLLYSFELAIARPVNRIGFDSSNGFRPSGYSVGGYEVTGSLTCKRDDKSLTSMGESATGSALVLDTTVFQISAPTCMVDTAAISFDDDGWKQTIPYRAVYTGATSSTIVTIDTTA